MKSNKVQLGKVSYWIEHELPIEERSGSWKVSGQGCFKFVRDDGTFCLCELEHKDSYGRSAEHAFSGLEKRIHKVLLRVVTFIQETQK